MSEQPQRSLDGYGPQEMAIPEWRLIQKVGGDLAKALGANPGQFHNSITDEVVDELDIIVADILMGRARWGTEIANMGPECATMDAKSNRSIFGDDCADCPDRVDAPWSIDAAERRTKCCLNYTILGINLVDYMPVMIRAHGISSLPARQLITQLKMNRALKGEYYRAVVNVKSVAKDTKYGTAYAIHPKITELVTDEARAKELMDESNRLLGTPVLLPEGRPEDELDFPPGGAPPEKKPIAFELDGKPIYDEQTKKRIEFAKAQQEKAPSGLPKPEPAPTNLKQPPAKPPIAQKTEKKEGEEEPSTAKPLDLDF